MMTKTDHDHAASTTRSHLNLNKGHTKPVAFESDEEGIEASPPMMIVGNNDNEDSVEEDTIDIEDGYIYTKSWTTLPSGKKILKYVIVGGLVFVVGVIAGASLMKRDGATTTTAYVENMSMSKTGKNTKAPKSLGCAPEKGACNVAADCCIPDCGPFASCYVDCLWQPSVGSLCYILYPPPQ
jgi:hypothetical protein